MIVINGQMGQPEAVTMDGGEAVVFSRPAPYRTGPNEDGAAVLVAGSEGAIVAVADGMGGGPSGEIASRLVLEELQRAAADCGADASEPGRLRPLILDALERANAAICDLGVGAATTIAAAALTGGAVRTYHVGDSGILVTGQRGRIKHQTVSHSPVGYAVESGLVTASEALEHPDLHLVSNMVGTPGMRIEVAAPLPLSPRDTLVLGTDGLFDNMTVAEVVERARKGPLLSAAADIAAICARRMADEDRQPGKPDDVTFVLYRPARARQRARSHRRG